MKNDSHFLIQMKNRERTRKIREHVHHTPGDVFLLYRNNFRPIHIQIQAPMIETTSLAIVPSAWNPINPNRKPPTKPPSIPSRMFSCDFHRNPQKTDCKQAQYEDSLIVEYDTPHTCFRVPALTLQPIVENAVKHGRDPDAEPLHIFIQTRETDSGSEIIVMDNGRGFDPDDTSDPGIAVGNIRQRLEMMCGGHLTITPNEGGGTVVTVEIPDRDTRANTPQQNSTCP